MSGFVLDDGTYYFIYSAVSNSGVVAGWMQGNGTSTGTTFASSNGRDFNFKGYGVLPATLSATYVDNQSISGAVTYTGGGSTAFSGTYDPMYEAIPSLAALAGTFTGQVGSSAGSENVAVTVMSDGTLSGIGASGCGFAGTAAPRAHGNVFNISITFGGAPCLFSNQTLSGIASFNATAKLLIATAPNAARTDGILFVGTKP